MHARSRLAIWATIKTGVIVCINLSARGPDYCPLYQAQMTSPGASTTCTADAAAALLACLLAAAAAAAACHSAVWRRDW
jgi:hypothetical protein